MVAAVDRQEEASTTLPIPTLNRRRIGGSLKFAKDFVGGERIYLGGPRFHVYLTDCGHLKSIIAKNES